jgi:hypothetical protein
MKREPISHETFGELKSIVAKIEEENANLRRALEQVWLGTDKDCIYMEEETEGYLDGLPDNENWEEVRRICSKYGIEGNYSY